MKITNNTLVLLAVNNIFGGLNDGDSLENIALNDSDSLENMEGSFSQTEDESLSSAEDAKDAYKLNKNLFFAIGGCIAVALVVCIIYKFCGSSEKSPGTGQSEIISSETEIEEMLNELVGLYQQEKDAGEYRVDETMYLTINVISKNKCELLLAPVWFGLEDPLKAERFRLYVAQNKGARLRAADGYTSIIYSINLVNFLRYLSKHQADIRYIDITGFGKAGNIYGLPIPEKPENGLLIVQTTLCDQSRHFAYNINVLTAPINSTIEEVCIQDHSFGYEFNDKYNNESIDDEHKKGIGYDITIYDENNRPTDRIISPEELNDWYNQYICPFFVQCYEGDNNFSQYKNCIKELKDKSKSLSKKK